jgi:hypothetical protein
MAMIDRNFTFATNGTVTANDLHNLIDSATIYQDLITGQQPITSVGTNYELLIADGTNPNAAPNAVTVYDLFEDALSVGTYTGLNLTGALTYGTATGTRLVSANATITTGTITTGVIPTLTSSTATFGTTTSTAATITSGTITNLASTTGTIATLNSTTGTIATLNSTTGTIATLNSTTGTITTLNSTTGTIPTLVATTLITTGTGTAAAPAIVPTGDTNTGIFFPAADTIAFSEGGTEGMRIDASGNVGIGTTSPATKLHVSGAGTTSGSYTNGDAVGQTLYLQDTGNLAGNGGQILFGASQGIFAGIKSSIVSGTGPAGNLIFQTRDTSGNVLDRMVVTREGNVGIGTSSPNASGQTHIVSASSSKAAAILAITATGSTSFPALIIEKQDNDSTTSQVFVNFNINAGGNGSGRINANGASQAAFGSNSDIRLKENITALPSQIDNVCALKPCEFDYKDGSGHQIGFIAQEIQEVYPDCVGDRGDGILTVTGWSKTEARLVKAVQELKAENDSLKSRIEALEAK